MGWCYSPVILPVSGERRSMGICRCSTKVLLRGISLLHLPPSFPSFPSRRLPLSPPTFRVCPRFLPCIRPFTRQHDLPNTHSHRREPGQLKRDGEKSPGIGNGNLTASRVRHRVGRRDAQPAKTHTHQREHFVPDTGGLTFLWGEEPTTAISGPHIACTGTTQWPAPVREVGMIPS